MKIYGILCAACFLIGSDCNQVSAAGAQTDSFLVSPISIIPQPAKLEVKPGLFALNSKTVIFADPSTMSLGKRLSETLAPATGFTLPVKKVGRKMVNGIVLSIDPELEDVGQEGYVLTATPNLVKIEAAQEAGIFYGIQTLRQLLPTDIYKQSVVNGVKWVVPCVEIKDVPRFPWRGMHLDVCRHYMPAEFVKKYIDLLALHKMNVFHWHLTDDQGWRIEIKKYPALTEIGAWRKETVVGRNTGKYDGQPHGGFYTQDQIRDIMEYARQRYVTIVPEIEMPGHALGALAAYPDLSCTGGPFEVMRQWGVFSDVFCAGNDKVFVFLQDVLDEVLELFPSQFIHVGGDECPKARWQNCAKCQARIKAEGLTDEQELQSWFVKRMEKYLANRGRRLIGWDEILEGGLAPGATVMSWRGEAGGIAAAKSGHDVVMASNSHLYFDYYQSDPAGEPLGIGGYVPLELVYGYNPVPAILAENEQKHILGVQAQIWAEYISTPEHAEYMAYPRACALSEIAWTPLSEKDYTDFYRRLTAHTKRLTALNVNYRPLDPPQKIAGYWKAGQTTETFQPMEWEITPLLQGSGTYSAIFRYTGGAHRLDIQSVEVLEDGVVISTDKHFGRTGGSSVNNTYTVAIPEHKKTAKYLIRAVVRSDGGSESNGTIYLVEK
ncbi:MAG: beta-N-acetylhexosaminidase [Planctomycetaceae bacterium]|nr:beta-N-acetylhexosaminidase [Planctomycetaceae bacterium]